MNAKTNYHSKLKKIQDCLKIWQTRDLSLIGRIQIIKTLAGSQLIYLMNNIMDPTSDFFLEVEKLMNNFLWKSHKIE